MSASSPPRDETTGNHDKNLVNMIEKLTNLVGNMNDNITASRSELFEIVEGNNDEDALLNPEKRNDEDASLNPEKRMRLDESFAGTEEFITNMLSSDAPSCSKDESASDNLIEALAQEMNVHESVGAPMNEQIIKWVHSLLKEKISDDKLKEKMS